ncbi:MAG: voltage-gated chloride channel family protein [Proteobacteria bacterium]|nr:voltage-gated chloride channel family protein [Pseudomonadota bacterium]
MQNDNRILLKQGLLSLAVGASAGIASTVFLFGLDTVTKTREENPLIIWFLPLAGLLIGYVYNRFGGNSHRGSALVIEEILNPRERISPRMTPLVLLSTLLTHLFGGSAGREGTAVQMGAALSDQTANRWKVDSKERKALLLAGAGAGFGSAIGAPWAGVIFGMEMIHIGKLRITAFWQCLVASGMSWFVTHLLGAPHTVYPAPHFFSYSLSGFFSVALASVFFGLLASGFARTTHLVESLFKKKISFAPIRPFVGGCILVALYAWEGSYRYAGLGISVIQESMYQPGAFRDVFFKFVFTVLTLASGFKGGEFIPLVFMGTSLGSAFSQWLPISSNLLGAVGFAAVFGAASNTPLASTLMAIELFGPAIAPYAFLGCFVSYFCSGHSGIYHSQIVRERKWERLKGWFKLPRIKF